MPASCAPTLERSKYVIYWVGESKSGYTAKFRQWEFIGALSSVLSARYGTVDGGPSAAISNAAKSASFTNLFTFNPAIGSRSPASTDQVDMYNTSLQVLVFGEGGVNVTDEDVFKATARCSLIHHTYLWLGEGATYTDLVRDCLKAKELHKVASSGETWRVRRYEFSFLNDMDNPRFGKHTTRSVAKERKSIPKIWPLLDLFKGGVDLEDPVIHLNLLEGLDECGSGKPEGLKKVVALTLACGAKHTTIAPKTRICKTTTPLCSISSHLLCNVAMVGSGSCQSVLDPFAGSAATLLAAAMISPEARTIGIDTGFGLDISRADLLRDFSTRGLTEPVALIQGDILDSATRDEARSANCGAFDVIMTDPPYLIREAFTGGERGMGAPLMGLLEAMGQDLEQGKPLLKRGGSLVSFVPCTPDHHIDELLPQQRLQDFAGLQLETKREQKINNKLSRWVSVLDYAWLFCTHCSNSSSALTRIIETIQIVEFRALR